MTAESKLADLASAGFRPGVVYDVGAYNCKWCLDTAKLFPEASYHLFEPLAQTAYQPPLLKARLQEMPPGTRLHPFALGDQTGVTKMAISPDPRGSTTLDIGLAAGTVYFPNTIEVKQCSIDQLVAEGTIPPAQLIKIDAQGSELAILHGGAETIQDYAAVLQLECWLYRSYGPNTPLLGEIIEFLDTLGFGVLDLLEPVRHESGKLHALDVFFAKADILAQACGLPRND